VKARRLSHFASISVGGLTSRGEPEQKKSESLSDSHRNDVSPLTQGLRYRAACVMAGAWRYMLSNDFVWPWRSRSSR